MKTKFFPAAIFVLVFFTGCLKEEVFRTYTMYLPHYAVKQEVKDAVKLQEPRKLENPGSFALYGTTMFINEKNEGIHLIDYSNPANPVIKAFLPIPGNLGLSLKNDVLYADCYSELFVFKVLENDIQFQSSVPNVFISRMNPHYYDEEIIEVTWTKRDTTVSENFYNNNPGLFNGPRGFTAIAESGFQAGDKGNTGNTSVGSSMAIFTIVNDFLYTVDQSNLHAFSLKSALEPALESSQHITWNVETIFPFKDKLFIGSMTGMFIYGIGDPAHPSYISEFNHVRVCDPVIADDHYAFVTLRGGSMCGGFTNQLDVLDIGTITDPVLVKSYSFTNPHGLSKDGNVLFVCDGDAGLKVVDAGDINNLEVKETLAIGKAIDVVALGGLAFVMLSDAIKIYSYDQQFNVQLQSTMIKG